MPASIVRMLETIADCPFVRMSTRMRAGQMLGRDAVRIFGDIFRSTRP